MIAEHLALAGKKVVITVLFSFLMRQYLDKLHDCNITGVEVVLIDDVDAKVGSGATFIVDEFHECFTQS